MPISFVAAAYTGAASASSVAVSRPAGVVAGDVLIAQVYKSGGAAEYPSPPAGWTTALQQIGSNITSHRRVIFTKVAGASEPSSYTFTLASGTAVVAGIVAYRGASGTLNAAANGVATNNGSTPAAPSVTTTVGDCRVVRFVGSNIPADASPPSGHTERQDEKTTNAGFLSTADIDQPAAGASGVESFTLTDSPAQVLTATVAIAPDNTAPNAPTSLSPGSAASINKDTTQRFSWAFSDPDSGDAQSAYDLRYRESGTTTWTTVSGGATQYRDLPAGTFTAGDWEWQVRNTDNGGLVSPWSASAFFTAASAPAGPTITAPTNGGTIDSDPYTVTWTAAAQDAYQIRTVADDGAGNPDTATIYTDTGTVTSTSTRARSVTFDTNGRTEHVQLRVQVDGLWSDWITVAATVSYTAPATPTITVTANSPLRAIGLVASQPAPAGSEPDVVTVDWQRQELDDDGNPIDGTAILLARGAGLGPTETFTDWQITSGRRYRYRARAWGDNGVSSWSDWETGDTATTVAFPYTLPLTLA